MTTQVLSLGDHNRLVLSYVKHRGDAKSMRALVGTGSSMASTPQVGRFWIHQHRFTTPNTAQWHSAGMRCTVPVHKFETFLFCQENRSTTAAWFKKKVCWELLIDLWSKFLTDKILISKQYIENLGWGLFEWYNISSHSCEVNRKYVASCWASLQAYATEATLEPLVGDHHSWLPEAVLPYRKERLIFKSIQLAQRQSMVKRKGAKEKTWLSEFAPF